MRLTILATVFFGAAVAACAQEFPSIDASEAPDDSITNDPIVAPTAPDESVDADPVEPAETPDIEVPDAPEDPSLHPSDEDALEAPAVDAATSPGKEFGE